MNEKAQRKLIKIAQIINFTLSIKLSRIDIKLAKLIKKKQLGKIGQKGQNWEKLWKVKYKTGFL